MGHHDPEGDIMATRSKTRSQASRGKRTSTRGRSTTRSRSGTTTTRRAGTAARTGNRGGAKTARRSSARARGGATTGRARGAAGRQQDAVALLKSEHELVNRLFEDFERATRSRGANGGHRKAEIAAEICRQLTIHAAIEEEIFYPAAAGSIRDPELIPEATVEHQTVKDLVAKIERMDPDEELFDATVTVLGEYVSHHVKEEQNEMFPRLKRAGLDLASLGDQLRDRRAQIEMR